MSNLDIIARLKLSGQDFSANLKKELGFAEKEFSNTGKVIGRNLSAGIGARLRDASAQVPVLGGALSGLSGTALVAAGAVGAVGLALAHGVSEAEGFEKAVRGLDAVLKASGNTTGYASGQLTEFAEAMEGKFAIAAEEIINAEKVLSSFDGVAGTTFKRAITLSADLAAVYGGDLSSNSEKLGLVLQNLAQGSVEGLSKGFKLLGPQTIATIKNLAETGRTAEAQTALLDALEQKVGGTGEAAGKGLSGAFFRLADGLGDASRAIVTQTGLYPTLVAVVDGLGTSLGHVADKLLSLNKWQASATLQAFLFNPLLAPLVGAAIGPKKTSSANSLEQLNNSKGYQSLTDYVADNQAKANLQRIYQKAEEERKAAAAREKAAAAAAAAARSRAGGAKAESDELMSVVEIYGKIATAARETGEVTRKAFADGPSAHDLIAAQDERLAFEDKLAEIRRESDLQDADRQRDNIRDLAGFYRDAMDGGTGSIWKQFEEAGKDAIAVIAAQWTLAMLSGQSFSLSGALSGVGATSGNPILSAISKLGGGGKGAGVAGAAGAADGAAKIAGVGGAGGLMGKLGLGGAGAALSAAAPYLAIAAFALPLVGGLFKKTKKGSATLGFDEGALGVISTTGNSASRKKAATSAGGDVADSLRNIAEQLGGTLGGVPTVSIGVRKKSYRVDTTGQGRTKGAGVLDFGSDQEAAIRAAISDALQDGVVQGVSDATRRILQSGQDLDKALAKATAIESIPKALKARLDPLGAAIDDLNAKWKTTIAALAEGGATAEQMADAQKLYNLELVDAKANARAAAATLKDFQESLRSGPDSPLSLREQAAAVKMRLDPYLGGIDRGEAVDQQGYADAAKAYLDIERQINGSTAEYFAAFDRIQAATNRAIATVDKAEPIRTFADPFAEATAKATQASAEIGAQQTQQLAAIQATLDRIAAGGAMPSAFIGSARGFI